MYLLLKEVSVAGAYKPSRLVLTLVDVDALGALLGLGKRAIATATSSSILPVVSGIFTAFM